MDHRAALALLDRLLDLALGGRCAGCGRSGHPTPCSECRRALAIEPRLVGAGWHHSGVAARLVLAAKHGTWRSGGRALAGLLIDEARLGAGPGTDHRVDLVTFVPADRRRRARRGGCLPERTARELARRLGVPCVALLVRSRTSRSQRDRTRVDRLRNARAAFELRAGTVPSRWGARVLLVDDVRTTGATLDACAALLVRAGLHPVPIVIVAAGSRVRETTRLAVSPSPGSRVWDSRNERGILTHEQHVRCRYGRSRRAKRSSRP